MFKLNCISLFLCLDVVLCYYFVPIDVDPWRNNKTPLDIMVDVTNRFGLRILYEHNLYNGNNVAFSPYGLTGIMIALYEGVNGESSYQIQQCLSLPWEKDLVRVGFRDIHRTLKTYFIPEEGFLAGLALNNENVTFREQYNNVLQFYGFEFASGLGTTMSPVSGTTFSTQIATTSRSEETTMKTVIENSNTSEAKDEQTPMATTGGETKPVVVETSPVSELTSTSPEYTTVPLAPTTPEEPAMESNPTSEDGSDITDVPMSTTISALGQSSEANMPTALPLTMASFMPTTINMETIFIPETTKVNVAESPDTDVEVTTSRPVVVTSASTEISNIITSTETTNTVLNEQTNGVTTESIPENTSTSTVTEKEDGVTDTYGDQNSSTETSEDIEITTPSESERKKRSLIEYVFQPTGNVEEIVVERPHLLYTSTRQTSNYNIFNENMFLVDGLRQVEVAYMTYNSILDYAYLPHLKASALRLPLDSDQYYLLIILPDFHLTLNDLIKLLAQESDLRDIYSSLRSTYVQACVPSFMVKGYVSLTTDLQRLGIRNVFEPRQNDFSPMTEKGGVYVRNIEQAITVTIRKYEANGNVRRIVPNAIPVRFSATYPFLYLVMDSKLHVALMAGKMVDPLNSRIL